MSSRYPQVKPAGQRKMVLDDTPTLALATVETARMQLPGHDEDDILALIEEGMILFAWNIGLGEARETRILPACIEHYRRTLGSRPFELTDFQATADLVNALRTGGKTFVKSTSVRILLNCGSTHIINLVNAKALKVVPNTTWGTGPNGAALITLDSFKQFLNARRLP